MKVLNFENYINEWVSNEPMVKFHIKNMLKKIQKKSKNKIKSSQLSKRTGSRRGYVYVLKHIKDYKIFEKILKSYQNNLIDKGILINYNSNFDGSFDIDKDLNLIKSKDPNKTKTFNIYIKTLHSIRVKPPRYVYHLTDSKNVDDILKNGLTPKSWDDGNWKSEPDLYYPPSIFAITDFSYWHGESIIQIDTKNLKNKWWKDLNFFSGYEQELEKGKSYKAIMTFDKIPPSNLELISEEGLYDIKVKN